MADRRTEKTTVLTSQAVTAAVNSATFYCADYAEALALLSVTVVSGTSPTLSPVVQTSSDGGTTWFTVSGGSTWVEADATSVTQLTGSTGGGAGTGQYLCAVTNIGEYLRVRLPAPGGTDTPTWTLSIVIIGKN